MKEPQPVLHTVVPSFKAYISINERFALVSVERRRIADRMIYFKLIEDFTDTIIHSKLNDDEYLSLTGKFRIKSILKHI